jgi:hypothetical protein
VGTVRRECSDWLLIFSDRHLERIVQEYVDHDNAARPHQALRPRAPLGSGQSPRPHDEIVRRDRLGGLIDEYERQAA